jgi:hypothetical protein
MFKSTGVILTTLVMLSACSVSGPRIRIEPPHVDMNPVTVKTGGGPAHCPPGHAKKNWC